MLLEIGQGLRSKNLPLWSVDTPGFGDSDGEDNLLINEMVGTLKEVIKTTNGFLLVFKGDDERFDEKSTQMIR